MFRQFRNIERGEHFVVGGDCSQGGSDSNWCQFLSKTKLDVPLVYEEKGVAADMTTAIFPVLEKIHSLTGLRPTVAFERNNGGASEMKRLEVLNRNNAYELFVMTKLGQVTSERTEETIKLGWDTNTDSRPTMLIDLKQAIDGKTFTIYDERTLEQLESFIVNRQGKPEAAPGTHDDAVFSLAIAWQLFLRVPTPHIIQPQSQPTQSSDRYGLFADI